MDCEQHGSRIFELPGLVSALQSSTCCSECFSGPVLYKESDRCQGLCTNPYFLCASCSKSTPIPFSKIPSSKVMTLNRKAVLANTCAGGNRASLQMLLALLDLPPPVSKNVYTRHLTVIRNRAIQQAGDSLSRARMDSREQYGVQMKSLVSCE